MCRPYGAVKGRGAHATSRRSIDNRRARKSGNQTARSVRSVDVDGGVACGGRMGTCILPANAGLDISKARGLSASNSTAYGQSCRPAIEVSQSRYKDVAPADTVVSRQPGTGCRSAISKLGSSGQTSHPSIRYPGRACAGGSSRRHAARVLLCVPVRR